MRRLFCLCLTSGLLLAGDGNGIRPRGNPNDYPVHQTAGGITVAGAVIPPDVSRKMFSVDLDKAGYVVVEIAIYPDNRDVELASVDFMLRIGSESDATRAINPRQLSAVLFKKEDGPPPKRLPVDVETTSTIGYENGRDPITGQRRSGVYTGTGVGVGTGGRDRNYPPPPQSTNRNRATIEHELMDKALPDGPTRHSVAGYLYFPKPSKRAKSGTYEVTYYAEPDKIRLELPNTTGK
jgi:hypothetical protein